MLLLILLLLLLLLFVLLFVLLSWRTARQQAPAAAGGLFAMQGRYHYIIFDHPEYCPNP